MWEHFHSIYLCSIYYISRPQSYPCYFAVHFFLLLWRCLLLECWIVFLYAFYVVLSSLYRFFTPFHPLPSPVYPTECSSCFFPGFLAIFILLSSQQQQQKELKCCTSSYLCLWNVSSKQKLRTSILYTCSLQKSYLSLWTTSIY